MSSNNTSYPGSFLLSPESAAAEAFLKRSGWLHSEESVLSIQRAGEGNMNCVMRVYTSQRSFILKQSRPWVEKYPVIAAPWDRALVEANFYQQVGQQAEVSRYLPKLLAVDTQERLLMLQDLGAAQDFTFLYSQNNAVLDEAPLGALCDFLIALHSSFRAPDLAARFANRDMRALNHEHIFKLPLEPNNGLNLDAITPGLAGLARHLSANQSYSSAVTSLGELYLNGPGACLIHGDFFPGSWLSAENRIYIIDPEFCFYGLPEWDLGVMAGHLYLSGHSHASVDTLFSRYAQSAPRITRLARQFAGVEIMRRLIGVAQLPLVADLNQKVKLLNLSRDLVLT